MAWQRWKKRKPNLQSKGRNKSLRCHALFSTASFSFSVFHIPWLFKWAITLDSGGKHTERKTEKQDKPLWLVQSIMLLLCLNMEMNRGLFSITFHLVLLTTLFSNFWPFQPNGYCFLYRSITHGEHCSSHHPRKKSLGKQEFMWNRFSTTPFGLDMWDDSSLPDFR